MGADRASANTLPAVPEPHLQRDQPPGVPPLALTGERTLPDVPAENYWYRRHLAVYEWIGRRVVGARVIDMACGEGYGADLLAAAGAHSVVGVDANPEAHEHARLRYRRPNLRYARDMAQRFGEPCDALAFLQTIEHVSEPDALLRRFRELVEPDGVAYVTTPNVLTLAPPGATKSDNPWHLREYRAREFAALCAGAFGRVDLLGLFHARRLRAHELVLRAGWDPLHRRLGLTRRFYDRFVPAISTRDFALRAGSPAALDGALDFLAVCRP